MLPEEIRVEIGQFHCIPDRLNLCGQPADVVVVDVGNLFENELLDLGFGDALEDVLRPGLEK
ncbi:unannotated protein [freshwater metagenome]|uniref:Unannotated protein n=1 Tax=freshwater metagenome TaxID=449393 RepID=A0A6J7KGZ0_9ZZZZ